MTYPKKLVLFETITKGIYKACSATRCPPKKKLVTDCRLFSPFDFIKERKSQADKTKNERNKDARGAPWVANSAPCKAENT